MELFFAESVRQELSTQPRIYVPACVSWTGHSGSFHEWTKYFRPVNSKPSYFVPKKSKQARIRVQVGVAHDDGDKVGACILFIQNQNGTIIKASFSAFSMWNINRVSNSR
jgi:hypothetical protein